MPRIDFNNVSETSDFAPIPDGEYTCRLIDIETDLTRAGDEMWKLRWEVESGEHTGRLLFDNLVFSQKALPRVKLVCFSCGLDVVGQVDLQPEMLLNRRAMVVTYQEEYQDDRGQAKVANRIPFDGYSVVPGDSDMPPF
jgi:hypothetical protein